MKIKEGYSIRCDPDITYIVKTEADGSETELSDLTETAALAWDGIAKGISRERIIEVISREFDGADPAMVEQDYDAFVAQLLQLGYIEE